MLMEIGAGPGPLATAEGDATADGSAAMGGAAEAAAAGEAGVPAEPPLVALLAHPARHSPTIRLTTHVTRPLCPTSLILPNRRNNRARPRTNTPT